MTRKSTPIGTSVMTAWIGWPSQRPFSRSRINGMAPKNRLNHGWMAFPSERAQPSLAAIIR